MACDEHHSSPKKLRDVLVITAETGREVLAVVEAAAAFTAQPEGEKPMQSLKRPGRTVPKRPQSVVEPTPEGVEPDDPTDFDAEELDAYDTFEMYRVICPDCAQPIALLADEEILPEHALCA